MPVTLFKQVANNISGTLLNAIAIPDTSITLSTGQGAQFPTVFPFFCSVDYEVMLCTNRVGDVLTVTRAQDSTTATIHAKGSLLEIREVGALWREAYAAINTLESGGANFPNPFTGLHLISPVVDSGGLVVTAGNLTLTAGDLTITAGKINITTAASQIIPGVTSFAIRNNANNANNLLLNDAGSITFRSQAAFGGGSPQSQTTVTIGGTVTGNTTGAGVVISSVTASDVTSAGIGLRVGTQTGAFAFTQTSAYGIFIDDAVKGAGSTITSVYGIRVLSQSKGVTNNYGIWIENPFGGSSDNYGLYNQGTSRLVGNTSFDGALIHSGVSSAASGTIRLANVDLLSWRNTANSADLGIGTNSNDFLVLLGGWGTQSTVGGAGGGSAPPATPVTYLRVVVAGTTRKIPLYND